MNASFKTDWLLCVLRAAGADGLTPVQLQKSLFLLSRRARQDSLPADFYDFKPYDYGPFDSSVYSDCSAFARANIITIEAATPYSPRKYVAVQHPEYMTAQWRVGAETNEFITKIVHWVKAKSFKDLVSSVYEMYPEMRARSIFRS